jgi:hypothetical protein
MAMSTKSLCVCFVVIFSGTLCFAQVPAKKTELTVADREAWQKVLRWPVELEEQWRRSRTTTDREQSGLVFHSLGHGNYLVAVEVHESAYQPRYIFMHYSESGKTPARLFDVKTYKRDKEGAISTKVSAEVEAVATFDTTKKQLVLHTKERGTGDCGSLARYNITATRAIPADVRAHACFNDYSLGQTDPQRWEKIKRL